MNRQNIVWHVALALMLVAAAAFVGQVRRWQNERPPFMETPRAQFDEHERAVPEQAREAGDVLVRFREGVSEGRIREIVESLNDEVDDEIESVGGLVEVHDNDGQAAEDTAAEYAALSEEVEYAEANAVIELDPLDAETREVAEAPAAEAAPEEPEAASEEPETAAEEPAASDEEPEESA